MKVTLDIDKLLAEGRITNKEYQKFRELSSRSVSSLATNIILGFGIVAVCGATLALLPSPLTALLLGLIIGCVGVGLHVQWSVLGTICLLLGALIFGGGLIWADSGTSRSFLATSVIFALAGIFAQNSLLISFSLIALSTTVGVATGYSFATYSFGTNEPTVTIVLFSLLSIGFYQLATKVAVAYARLAVTAARTSLFLVNLAFWVASLWGDSFPRYGMVIPSGVYAITWAIALIATSIWAWKQKRAWPLNMAAIFGGINFYTQWFERLGAEPWTVLCGGILALLFALWLFTLNNKIKKRDLPT